MKKIFIIIVSCILIISLYFIVTNQYKKNSVIINPTASSTEKIKLVYAVHWMQDDQINGIFENEKLKYKGLQQYIDEYQNLNPNVEISIKQINYADYANTLKVLSDSDLAPDIYQIYAPWGVSYVKESILNEPPQYIKDDVIKNYLSTAGVTINNKIWGIPTEINTYTLLYNKDIFKKAGLIDSSGNIIYPKTWSELVNTASKLTKKDNKGNIIQFGIAFNNEDWQVVDPFLSLLYSNGGKYLASDFSKSLFNNKEGVDALDAELQLFKNDATNLNANFFDFGNGTVGMVIAPPWVKSSFAVSFGNDFQSKVGVAPLPPIKNQLATGYSWFMGVMEKSKYKDESWKFLNWFSSNIQQETGTTRYGDLLSNNIGAIPARKIDLETHKLILGDFFTKVYVDQLKNAVQEPNVLYASEIKSVLMKEILLAWGNKITAKEALNNAANEIDKILLNK